MDNLETAQRVRNLLSERSPAATNVTVPHIIALIPSALSLWTEQILQDPANREYFMSTFTDTLTAGELDLGEYLDGTTAKINLKDLRASTIYVTDGGKVKPMTWLSSYRQLTSPRYPKGIPGVFLEGKKLLTADTTGSLTGLGTSSIKFTTIDYPEDTADIPSNLEGAFITFLATLAIKELTVDGQARPR